MLYLGLGTALLSLVLIPWALWRLAARRNRYRWWWPVAFIPGYALARVFHEIEYMAGASLKVAGFPLPVAFFEYEAATDRWLDFVGCLTPIAYFGNPVIGFLLPLVPVAITTLFPRKKEGKP